MGKGAPSRGMLDDENGSPIARSLAICYYSTWLSYDRMLEHFDASHAAATQCGYDLLKKVWLT